MALQLCDVYIPIIYVQVDSELRTDQVTQMFGHFVKFCATEIGEMEARIDETTGLVCRIRNKYTFTFQM